MHPLEVSFRLSEFRGVISLSEDEYASLEELCNGCLDGSLGGEMALVNELRNRWGHRSIYWMMGWARANGPITVAMEGKEVEKQAPRALLA